MADLAIVASVDSPLARGLSQHLRQLHPDWNCLCLSTTSDFAETSEAISKGVVYIPSMVSRDSLSPDINEARRLFDVLSGCKRIHAIVISSALVYGAGPARQHLVC